MRGYRTGASIVAVAIMLLSMMSVSVAADAAQDENEASSGEQLFTADGVDASILGRADIPELDPSATLLLELIDLPPDSELTPHTTTSPELFHILSGVVVFQDNFGFASVVEAGNDVSLNPGTEYTIVNQETEPGRVLRLRLAAAGGEGSGPAATPVAAAGGATVLVQTPLQDLQLENARMYLARVQFGAGADTGEQGHAGPIGLYVESGTLNVVSPSGLVGAIDAGRAVSLPAETPLRASTGDTEAVAFIAGVSGAEEPAFVHIRSESDGTAPASVLESGQTWQTEGAELTVEIIPFENITRFVFTYTNTGDAATEVRFDRSLITVTDDRGREWTNPFANCEPSQQLAPGESLSCRLQLYPPAGTDRGPLVLTIHVDGFGHIEDATWQREIDW